MQTPGLNIKFNGLSIEALTGDNVASENEAPVPVLPPAQTEVSHSLDHILQSLLEMGICATDVQEAALETASQGAASQFPGGLLGKKTTQLVEQLDVLHKQKDQFNDILIPLTVLDYVDNGKNPNLYTKEFVERLASENMYTHGILTAVASYKDQLTAQLVEAFPDLGEFLIEESSSRKNGEGDRTTMDAAAGAPPPSPLPAEKEEVAL